MKKLIGVLCLLLSPVSAAYAQSEKRVALVIGNSDYAKVSKLPNPTRDVGAVEAMLRAAKFDVVEAKRDLNAAAMRRALRDFSDKVRDADIAVVFYAGHGIEVNGTNYLIPVDATLERDIDVEDEAVPLDRVTQILDQAKRLRLVILDACRDNPFVRSMRRTTASRSIGRGLARVDILASDTLIAFAAKAGSTASDGEGANSPYTGALVKHLTTPGLDLRLALGRVRDEVLKTTANRQEPFVYGSLGGAEIALVTAEAAKSPVVAISPPPTQRLTDAGEAWAMTKDTQSIPTLEAFIRRFENTYYGDLAKVRLADIKQADAMTEAAKKKADDDARARAEGERQRVALLQQEEEKKWATALAAAEAAKEAAKEKANALALARNLQSELRRVGCDPGNVEGKWDSKAKEALNDFVRLTKATVSADQPSDEVLRAVEARNERICPLRCATSEQELKGKCVARTKIEPRQVGKKTPVAPKTSGESKGAKEPTCWTTNAQYVVPCADPRADANRRVF